MPANHMQNKLFAPWALTGRARTRGERGKGRKNDATTLQLGRWLNRAGAHGALARAQRQAKQEGRRAPDRHCTAPGCCRCVKARVFTSALELDMERRAAGRPEVRWKRPAPLSAGCPHLAEPPQ